MKASSALRPRYGSRQRVVAPEVVQHEVEPRERAAAWLVRRGVRPELAPLVAELWGLGGRAA